MSDNVLLFSKPSKTLDTSPTNITNILLGDYETGDDFENFDSEKYKSKQLDEIETLRQFAAAYEFNRDLMAQSLEGCIASEISENWLQKLLSFFEQDNVTNTNCYTEDYEDAYPFSLESQFEPKLKGDSYMIDFCYLYFPENALLDLKSNYLTVDGEPIEPKTFFSTQAAKTIVVNHYDEILALNIKLITLAVGEFFDELIEGFNNGLSNTEIFDLYESDTLEIEQEPVAHKLTPKP